jgi:hypothetical protein
MPLGIAANGTANGRTRNARYRHTLDPAQMLTLAIELIRAGAAIWRSPVDNHVVRNRGAITAAYPELEGVDVSDTVEVGRQLLAVS